MSNPCLPISANFFFFGGGGQFLCCLGRYILTNMSISCSNDKLIKMIAVNVKTAMSAFLLIHLSIQCQIQYFFPVQKCVVSQSQFNTCFSSSTNVFTSFRK